MGSNPGHGEFGHPLGVTVPKRVGFQIVGFFSPYILVKKPTLFKKSLVYDYRRLLTAEVSRVVISI